MRKTFFLAMEHPGYCERVKAKDFYLQELQSLPLKLVTCIDMSDDYTEK